MSEKYYAVYSGTNVVLVFDTLQERDEYVNDEQVVHPECIQCSFENIKHIINGKNPSYSSDFGCMVII